MTDWLRGVYDDADSLNAAAFAAHFAETATFTMGNNPAMEGPEQIEAGLNAFFGTITGMNHAFTHRFTSGTTEVMEADVTYTLPSGQIVVIPGSSVVERSGDTIVAMRAYIDLMPLFASAGGQ